LEAETYLASGYGIRAAIQEHGKGWVPLNQFAKIWQPNRLKGILVSPKYGTPFLAATQVFDIRPVSRKWLAVDKIASAAKFFVKAGTIVVTRSGAVGRATMATEAVEGVVISDDLLRVEPRDIEQWGWVYAFLRSPQARAMMTSAQYGHIIKHLEASHLEALPIPEVDDETAEAFRQKVQRILGLRNQAHVLAMKAEALFEDAVGSITVADRGESGFEVSASVLGSAHGRRLEAAFHNPACRQIRGHLQDAGHPCMRLGDLNFKIWVPNRYQRIPAEFGVDYFDSSDLLEINPESIKRFVDGGFGDSYGGRVQKDWILLPSSGQVYGIIGNAVLAGPGFDGKVLSNHVIRIAPKENASVQPGYLQVALSHPKLGRPLIKALAFGSSVPEIDPQDLEDFPVVRLGDDLERQIAQTTEKVVAYRAEADALELAVGDEAGDLVGQFMVRGSLI
jgi:hypothetical protein